MDTALRLLLIEDNEDDALLILRSLRKRWPALTHTRVMDLGALDAEIPRGPWDLVISDYNLRSFTGREVLDAVKKFGLDVPFLIVSGTIGEETAVQMMKAGAHDYIMKDKLARLVPAAEREMRECAMRAEYRRAEAALMKWGNAVRSAGWGVTLVTPGSHLIETPNPALSAMYGYTGDELEGRPFTALCLPAAGNTCVELAFGSDDRSIECMQARKDGSEFPAQINVSALKGPGGEVISYAVSVEDITERKAAEEKIKRSLVEKEVLLKEIHHRVKNNMALISSMLNLQSRYVKDEATVEMFIECRSRIKSMALIHERLYKSEDMVHLDLSAYLNSLVYDLITSIKGHGRNIRHTVEADPVDLDLDTLIPSGLLVNELVTNSLKHAFDESIRDPEISVAFRREDNGGFLIEVRDNGRGLPKGLDFDNPASLGLMLVNALTKQLNGEMSVSGGKGAAFRISFSPQQTGH